MTTSSRNSNIISRIVAGIVGPGEADREFMRADLLDKLGIRSFAPHFDAVGTFYMRGLLGEWVVVVSSTPLSTL